MKTKRLFRDFLLISALILGAGLMALVFRLTAPEGAEVEISLGGEVYAVLPLYEDTEVDVSGLCRVMIAGGKTWVESAVCKNQICVKHAPISRAGQTIVCLPSAVTVRVLSADDSGTDFYI